MKQYSIRNILKYDLTPRGSKLEKIIIASIVTLVTASTITIGTLQIYNEGIKLDKQDPLVKYMSKKY